MIWPGARVQWLDLKSGEPHEGTLLDLFSMYSIESKSTDRGSIITFPSGTVKVTDWMGWTDLVSIERINNVPQTAFIQAGAHQLRLKADALIACYDTNPLKGFHGETKYRFTIKRLWDIPNGHLPSSPLGGQYTGEIVRTRRNDEGEFVPLQLVCRGDSHDAYPFVYQLTTLSCFININNIHMWARETIPEDYCLVCPNRDNHQCSGCRK